MHARQTRGEKPNVRRKYLAPDEARCVIEASARAGRRGERDRLLLTLIYRGLRVSEAVDLRWTNFNLDGQIYRGSDRMPWAQSAHRLCPTPHARSGP
jgi:site-specific recombinase XerD